MTDEMLKEVVVGTIGPGANQVAIEWCIKDLADQHYRLWHFSLNHYRNIYGYTQKTNDAQIGLFPVCLLYTSDAADE